MKQKEIQLFKELCKFKSDTFDENLLEYATAHVLGQLFFNRMQGVAYGTLCRHGLLGKVNREFRNSLKGACEQNLKKNDSFVQCVKQISDVLIQNDYQVAMLKGAWLCSHYPEGYRTSNDIDLLVRPEDVTAIGRVLESIGFRQGYVRNGEFLPATRREIITSKMMRGETVPYIRQVDLPGMKYLEVDINFSLDYKNSETDVLEEMLKESVIVEENEIRIPTLNREDFFLHLCAHLYKEATTFWWVKMHRDMTFYKYCDIYMLLNELSEEDVSKLFVRAKALGMEKICGYAIIETAGLFDISDGKALKEARRVLEEDLDFVLRVISPEDKKHFIYQTRDVEKRFFMTDRAEDLKEVKYHEKTEDEK